MSEEQDLKKILTENQNKLTDEEVTKIANNIIMNEWPHNIEHSPSNIQKNKIDVNENLYQDLEVFVSYNHDINDTVYKKINYTKTQLGNHYLQQILLNPTKNIEQLKKRQQFIKSLIENTQKQKNVNDLLEQLKECQNDGLWTWKEKSPEFNQLFEILYFKNPYLQPFNSSEWFLKIYNYFQIIFLPIYGLIAPILFFIIPYVILRFFFGLKLPFMFYFKIIKSTLFGGGISSLFGNSGVIKIGQLLYQALTVFLYCYGIYNSFKAAYTLNNIIDLIHQKVNSLAKFIKTSYQLYQECKTIFTLEPLTVSYLELWDNIFDKDPYLLSDKGKILRTFFLVSIGNEGKTRLTPLLQMVGMIDAFNSIATLHIINKDFYTHPEYLLYTDKPILESNDIWHPFLDSSKSVKNDFKLGNDFPNNMLITGPNASGKSTFIKSVVLGVLMAQTISIVPCKKMIMSPFQLLNTYLNIPDAKGRESLFEAEMYRAKNHITAVNALTNRDFSLVVMDEIFNSTNYEEGVAGAYIIGKELGRINNSLSIITTHFGYLTKLSKTGHFTNYMFEVEKKDSQIIKSYKIKEGTSKQYLALDLLEKNGYTTEMIQEARTIFQELVDLNEHYNQQQETKQETQTQQEQNKEKKEQETQTQDLEHDIEEKKESEQQDEKEIKEVENI
jgi:DNA mismatch repair protein MutS